MEGSLWDVLFNGGEMPTPREMVSNFLTGVGLISGGLGSIEAANTLVDKRNERHTRNAGKVIDSPPSRVVEPPSQRLLQRREESLPKNNPPVEYKSSIDRRKIEAYEERRRAKIQQRTMAQQNKIKTHNYSNISANTDTKSQFCREQQQRELKQKYNGLDQNLTGFFGS